MGGGGGAGGGGGGGRSATFVTSSLLSYTLIPFCKVIYAGLGGLFGYASD